jgi:hypothetical protein
MAKKQPSQKLKESQEKAASPLEKEIIKIVEKHHKELSKKDIKEIVNTAMPNLDRLIAEHVKDHFLAIADYIKKSFE